MTKLAKPDGVEVWKEVCAGQAPPTNQKAVLCKRK
uniref:Uncharacterized protein n=1 Tax=Anguilla anguilla TaxID=7936 RepID=A0A0E9SMK2_ANGAN